MTESMWVRDVNEQDFEAEVLKRSYELPVLVDFWADWCQPCQMLSPLLAQLAEEYAGGFLLAKVDVGRNQMLAQQLQVSRIPMVIAVVEGKIVDQFTGALPEIQLRAFVDQLIPSEIELLIAGAMEKEASAPGEATQLYEQALALQPANSLALAGLAHVSLLTGDYERASELAHLVSEGSDGWPRASNVRTQLELHETAENLGSLADCQAKCQAQPDDLRAKLDLGIALAAAGQIRRGLGEDGLCC